MHIKELEVQAKRQEWHSVNATEYKGDATCNACGQPLPENMKADARRLFEETKQNKLAQIREITNH